MRFNNFCLAGLVIGWMSACTPKEMAGSGDASADDTGASDTSNGSADGSSGSSGVTTGMTGMTGVTTGMTGECTPGDTRPGPFDCGEDCVCSDAGQWECPVVFACSETGPVTTNETDETASGSTAGESGESGGTGESGETGTGGSSETGETVVVDLPACDKLAPSDPFMLDKVAVVGDLLNVEVSFGGGCEKHDFVLCVVEFKGDAVQLGLDHDAHADPCDAFLMESRDLDLTPLQVLPSPVTLLLLDWPNELQYVF